MGLVGKWNGDRTTWISPVPGMRHHTGTVHCSYLSATPQSIIVS